MKRTEKYPNTETFHYFNANPKNKITDDCVVRAISTATGIAYDEVLDGLCSEMMKTGYSFTDEKCFGKYLEEVGWVKCRQPRKVDYTKYTGVEFCRTLQLMFEQEIPSVYVNGIFGAKKIIANIGGHHMVAIMDGVVFDHWDSTDGCIGNYWIEE